VPELETLYGVTRAQKQLFQEKRGEHSKTTTMKEEAKLLRFLSKKKSLGS